MTQLLDGTPRDQRDTIETIRRRLGQHFAFQAAGKHPHWGQTPDGPDGPNGPDSQRAQRAPNGPPTGPQRALNGQRAQRAPNGQRARHALSPHDI